LEQAAQIRVKIEGVIVENWQVMIEIRYQVIFLADPQTCLTSLLSNSQPFVLKKKV